MGAIDGHYVAHIRRSLFDAAWAEQVRAGEHTDEWIIYNDEQVARSERPPYPNAYLYFFRRLDAPSLT
ncbi:unnamed protein product [Protopolystoma xenopodis]|uniref:USP domain-containing protein n=1 Tax=Protopolystoma xenopodis TaxID=117903 RepID=A0A3S5BLW5_9PLAT|nr:unnamed protein product [Protopolystoma xenopodis]